MSLLPLVSFWVGYPGVGTDHRGLAAHPGKDTPVVGSCLWHQCGPAECAFSCVSIGPLPVGSVPRAALLGRRGSVPVGF